MPRFVIVSAVARNIRIQSPATIFDVMSRGNQCGQGKASDGAPGRDDHAAREDRGTSAECQPGLVWPGSSISKPSRHGICQNQVPFMLFTNPSHIMKLVLAMLAAVLFLKFTCPAQAGAYRSLLSSDDTNYILDSNLYAVLASNVVKALNSESNASADAALHKMLSEGVDKVTCSFIAAKMEWLLNRPARAISILEDVIQKHGDDEVYMAFPAPVAIKANFWIGTISRQNGDAKRALKAYDDILKYVGKKREYAGRKITCYQYIAEINATLLKQTNAAIDALAKIKQMPSPFEPEERDEWNIERAQVDYQIAVLKGNQDSARKTLEGSDPKILMTLLSVEANSVDSGIAGQPWLNFGNDLNRVLLKQELQMALKSGSPMDRSLALFELGHECESDQPAEAEKYYDQLLESDSVYAPEGGIFLADFQKRQGKLGEAARTYQRIKERFPKYAKYVDKLSKDPSPLRFGT